MPPFRFRLTTLLRLREADRDQRRAQLAEAHLAEDKLRQHIAELDRQLADLRHDYSAHAAPGPVEVDRLVSTQRYELVLMSQRQTQHKQAQLLAAEVERRRLMLVEADREVRVLEKLRDRQHERHREDEARQETKLLDEIALRTTAETEWS